MKHDELLAQELERQGKQGLEAILTCQICIHIYNQDDRVPLILRCGHTVCRECAKGLTKGYSDRRCPFDKISIDFANPDFLSKNYSLLDLLESLKGKRLRPDEKFCEKHPKKKAKFYCQTHAAFVCSDCLAAGDHLGHDLKPSGPIILNLLVTKQIEDAKEGLNLLDKERAAYL